MAVSNRPHDCLVVSLTLVTKLQASVLRRRLATIGLHEGQALTLAELHRKDGLTQSQLAARLRVEAPTVTNILHGLEEGGFVLREPHPFDARARRVCLTPRGAALRADLERVWAETEVEAYAGFNAAERHALKSLFDSIVAGAPPKLSIFDHPNEKLGPKLSLFERPPDDASRAAADSA